MRLATGLLCLVVLASAACATKPTMQLHHAELTSASLYGVGLDVILKVDNPNSYDVQIRNVRAQAQIGYHFLPPLVFSPNQWLPAGEITLVRVPMVIPYALIPQLLAETVGSPVLRYRVRGSADVTAVRLLGIERDNYPLDEEGTVSRVALVAAAGISR